MHNPFKSNQIKSNQIKSNQITLFIHGYLIRQLLYTNTICPQKVSKHQLKVACKQALRSGVYLSWPRVAWREPREDWGAPSPIFSPFASLAARRSPQICRTKTLACTLIKRSSVSLISFHFSAHTSIRHVEHNEQYPKKTLLISSHICAVQFLLLPPSENPRNKTLLSRPIPGVGVESN